MGGIQLYDINKDKWDKIVSEPDIFEDFTINTINDVFICDENPNYLYMIGNARKRKLWEKYCVMQKVDLRMKQFIDNNNHNSMVMTDELIFHGKNCCVIHL